MLLALLTAAISWAARPAGQAQIPPTLTTLYSFLPADSAPPFGFVQSSDGNFYGTASSGGSNNLGTVFRINPATRAVTTLHTFSGPDGANPLGALVQGSDGTFYGVTHVGGAGSAGTVYQLTPAGALTTLYSFTGGSDGANPVAALVQGSDGSFYGTTFSGGANNDGTVFRITPAGALTTLYSFTGSDGQYPQAALVQGSDGSFYGTTFDGGVSNSGAVFRITPAGALTTLYSFTGGSDGANPVAALVQDGNGSFYGTTPGSAAGSTVFQITAAGAFATLYNFGAGNIVEPNGLTLAKDGNFYGTTANGGSNNGGTLFQVTPAGAFATLYSFTGGGDGGIPDASLVLGNDGNLYGSTSTGGTNNDGTIFALTVAGVANAGSLQLYSANMTTTENAGTVTLAVVRTAGGFGAVSVDYSTADATATAGTDYQAVSGTLSWAFGDFTPKTITVPIVDRQLSSGSTSFLVNLSNPGGGAVFGVPSQANVTILDTEAAVPNIQSVTLLSPPAGTTIIQNQPVTLHANTEVLGNTLANVEFFAIDSAGNSTDLGGFQSQRGNVIWQPTAAGDYTVQVVATDIQGHATQAAEPVHVVSPADAGTAPQTTLDGELDRLTLPLNTTVQVIARAVDASGNALTNVQFYLDGVPVSGAPLAAIRKAENKAADATADTLFLADVLMSKAAQLLTAVGTTASGVSSVSPAVTLYAKAEVGAPPTATISNLASGASVPTTAGQSVNVNTTSGSQRLAKVELVVDNQSVGTATAAPFTFNLPALVAGSHAMSVIATDIGALSSVSAPVLFTAQEATASTPAFFAGQVALGNGVDYLAFPNGNFFGYYSFLPDPAYLFHFDLGFEYVFDALDGHAGVYLYDFASGTFFYTSPSFPFPYLYDFSLNSVLFYYPDPNNAGHYNTGGVRYFFDFNTNAIIIK